MKIYCVKVMSRITKEFLNNNEMFTKNGRIFSNISNAKKSVSGKLQLSRMPYRNIHENTWWRESIRKYLNCDFVIYTDEGVKYESVKDYIINYLKNNNCNAVVEYINEFE